MESEIHNLFQDTRMDPVDDNPNNGFVPSVDSKSDGLHLGAERNLELSLPPNNFTRADAMKNCGQWVDSQQQLQETQRSKRKRIEDVEEHCDSPGDIDEEPRSPRSTCSSTVKERPKFVQLKNEQLNLKCEWRDCDYTSTKLDPFVRHVSMHIPELEVKTADDEEVYVCLWESCGFETTNSKEIVRHVNFHSYHTKIKCIGTNVAARQNLPPCTYDKDGRNLLPDLPDVFTCGWEDCDQVFNNSQMYFYHVQIHIQHVTPIQNNVKSVPCSWRGCRSVFRSVYKLVDHMRTHTQEKVVGCPTCGGLFASKTKFFDHCKRQVPMELQGYQCSHCFKYYPSERLIRDHMRHHINHYKCSFCDMTCPTPSSLSQHIRYRHLDIKPFKCDFCEYTAKSQYDLKNHVTTHYSDPLYRCEEEGCNFSCRSAYGLNRHFRKFHRGDDEALYCCHICQERFHRGSILTRHLFIKHSFRWPSGHCRFRYKHGEDGLFRLQTVRYESLEVTQEMLQSESGANEQPVCGNSRFSLHPVNSNSNNGIMFTVSENEENEDNPDDPNDPENQPESGGRILISIEELDSSGKVVRTKVLEADEVPSIPLGSATLIQDGGEVHTESEQ